MESRLDCFLKNWCQMDVTMDVKICLDGCAFISLLGSGDRL